MLPVIVRGGGMLARSPAARAAIAPAITTVTGVARDVTRKVASRQLAKGVTIGSLATLGIDAAMDLILDDPETAAANAKQIASEETDLQEHQVDALIELSNQLTMAHRHAADTPEGQHDMAVDSSEHEFYGMPKNALFELPTDQDADRKRAERLYSILRNMFSFEQIEAFMMLSVIAQSAEKDQYLDHLEGNFDVTRA